MPLCLMCCCDLSSLGGILQGGLNALHLAATGNHVEVVRALVGEFGLSVTHRDNVSLCLTVQCPNRVAPNLCRIILPT